MTELPPPPSEVPTPPGLPAQPPPSPPPPLLGSGQRGVHLDQPQRQSLLAIIFLAGRTIRQVGIVQIFLVGGFALSRSPSVAVLIVGVLVVAAVFLITATLSWWRYTFSVNSGELRVDRGVLSRNTLTVPLDRIQSVSIEQKFLHRMVKLVQVSLDTAGTSSAEFTFDAVDRSIADELQRVAADYRSSSTTTSAETTGSVLTALEEPKAAFTEKVVIQHSASRLVRLALSRVPFSGLAFLAPLFAFGDDLVERIPFDTSDFDLEAGLWLLWFVPAAILVVTAFGVILNLFGTFLREWNLRVTQTESGLRRDAGLLSTTSVASSVSRVQSMETRQGRLGRLVGLQNVTLHNIGEGNFSVPGCTPSQVAQFRALALPDATANQTLDRRVSSAEVFKATRNAAVFFVALAIALFAFISWWVVLFVVPILLVWASARRSVRLRRWGIDDDSVALRTEFVECRVRETLIRKANGVSISQSYFERSRGLATVEIRLAGGILSGAISIGMIPYEEAVAVRDRVLYVVETDAPDPLRQKPQHVRNEEF